MKKEIEYGKPAPKEIAEAIEESEIIEDFLPPPNELRFFKCCPKVKPAKTSPSSKPAKSKKKKAPTPN